MKKLYQVSPTNNFLSNSPARALVSFNEIRKTNISMGVISSGGLIITPYAIDCTESKKIDILRDTSWVISGGLDLRSFTSVDSIVEKLSNHRKVHLIGALEWIDDPRPLLKSLRYYLMSKDGREVIYWHNKEDTKNDGFRYYDDLNQVSNLLELSGFKAKIEKDHISISCNINYYETFLEERGLPKYGIEHIIVTDEHPDYKVTGGIGSYVKEALNLYGENSTLLLLDDGRLENRESIASNRWFSAEDLIGREKYIKLSERDSGGASSAILESLYQIMFYYDQLKLIEGSDYKDSGLFRVIQAKKSGLLPESINTVTVCHGSTIYVSNAASTYPPKGSIGVVEKENYSIINSDATVFLTNFVDKLYESYGIKASNKIKSRLPIDINYYYRLGIEMPARFERVSNIFYIGKLNKMKGADYFLDTMINLAKRGHRYQVTCASSYNSPEPEVEARLLELGKYKNLTIEIKSFSREDLIREINHRAKDSIAIIPYPADNHPNVVLELMLAGMDFIASKTGGIPELIPMKDYFITSLNHVDMANKLLEMSDNREYRYRICLKNRKLYLDEQKNINKDYSSNKLLNNLHERHNKASRLNTEEKNNSLGLIIPCYNTDFNYINELCFSISNQSLLPEEVVFINDGSTIENYEEGLNNIAKESLIGIKYKVITQPNKGLASARNLGLKSLKTKYVLTIDSDDIVDNYYLENMLNAISLCEDNETIAVTPYLKVFYDGLDHTLRDSFHDEYMPYGSNLGTSFFPSNNYGSAAAIFKRQELIDATGGWDESSRAMYEDWSLYIKLNVLGYKINVLPRANYFYRVRKSSMLRSYDPKDGYLRLISNYTAMPRMDAYMLFSQMFNYYNNSLEITNSLDNQKVQDVLHSTFGTFDTPRISKLVRVSKALDIYDKKVPTQIRKPITKGSNITVRALRKIRSKLK